MDEQDIPPAGSSRRRFLGLLGAGAAGAAGAVVAGRSAAAAAPSGPAAATAVAETALVAETLATPVPAGAPARPAFPVEYVSLAGDEPLLRLDGGRWQAVPAGCPARSAGGGALAPAGGAATVEVGLTGGAHLPSRVILHLPATTGTDVRFPVRTSARSARTRGRGDAGRG